MSIHDKYSGKLQREHSHPDEGSHTQSAANMLNGESLKSFPHVWEWPILTTPTLLVLEV